MGRAERRQLERRNRIQDRKDKVLLSRQDIAEMKRDVYRNVDNFRIEALMTCFALANRRLYGHGPKRIMRSLNLIDELMCDIYDDKATIDDYKKELEDDAGVIVKCE